MLCNSLVGKGLYEIGLPVPLHPGRIQAIEKALQRRMRNGANQIDCRGLETPDRSKYFLRFLHRSGVTPNDATHLFVVKVLGERRPRWHGVESKKTVNVIGRLDDEVAVPAHHLGSVFHRPEHWATVDGVHWVRFE